MCKIKFSVKCIILCLFACLLFIKIEAYPEEPLIYYNRTSHQPFRIAAIQNRLTSSTLLNLVTKTNPKRSLTRFVFRANGCNCASVSCSCCTEFKFPALNFTRSGCVNLIYDPYEFSISLQTVLDENVVSMNTISAKNPPPLCIPIGGPAIPVSLGLCGHVSDVHIVDGQNLHVCFDLETQLQQATVLILQFNCMILGGGVPNLVNFGTAESLQHQQSTTEQQNNSDIYDDVSRTININY